jgi:hypothetical protein
VINIGITAFQNNDREVVVTVVRAGGYSNDLELKGDQVETFIEALQLMTKEARNGVFGSMTLNFDE